MDEEACRKDDELMRERRKKQSVKEEKQMTFMDWIGEYLKREENCNGEGSGSLDG